MKRIMLLIIILSVLIGCGGVSFYRTNTYIISAKQTDSGCPAVNYPIRLIYPYDHYGIFYIWNAPSSFESFLDKQGQLEINISSFGHPQLVVGSTVLTFDKEFFKEGKPPFKVYETDDKQYKRYRENIEALKLPVTKFPEVDIDIKILRLKK